MYCYIVIARIKEFSNLYTDKIQVPRKMPIYKRERVINKYVSNEIKCLNSEQQHKNLKLKFVYFQSDYIFEIYVTPLTKNYKTSANR